MYIEYIAIEQLTINDQYNIDFKEQQIDNQVLSHVFPPLVLKEKENQYILVENHNIVISSSEKTFPVLVIDKSVSAIQVWQMKLVSRLHQQNLNLLDLALIVFQLQTFNDGNLPLTIKQLDLSKQIPELKEYTLLLWFAQNYQKLHKSIDIKKMTLRDLQLLRKLKNDDLHHFLENTTGFQLQGNKLYSLLEIVIEIQKMRQESVATLFEKIGYQYSENQDQKNYGLLKQKLIQYRYPLKHQMQSQMEQKIKLLDLPQSVGVDYDQNFEDNLICFKIKAKNLSELKQQYKLLIDNKNLNQIFDFFNS